MSFERKWARFDFSPTTLFTSIVQLPYHVTRVTLLSESDCG